MGPGELVTSARVVCRSRPAIAALTHVCGLIGSFLTPPRTWTIPRAIRSGSTHLADIVVATLAADSSVRELEKRSQARKGVHAAASVGNADLIQRLVETFGCAVDEWGAREAVRGGHMEALQRIYDFVQRGIVDRAVHAPQYKMNTKLLLPPEAIADASKLGNLAMVQWIWHVRGGRAYDYWPLELPETGGLAIVEWLWSQAPRTRGFSREELGKAVAGGHEDVLRFLHERQALEFSSQMTAFAASNGHLGLAQWMHSVSGEIGTLDGLYFSVKNGHLESTRWLCDMIKPSEGSLTLAMKIAAQQGHLEIVKFLCDSQHGACSQAVMDAAAGSNRMDIIKYLASNFGEGCSRDAMDLAASNGHLEMITWLHHRYEDIGCTTAAMDSAAGNGHLEIVQWLDANRSEGCTTAAMDSAAGNGHLEIVQWLDANRSEGCTTAAMDSAAGNGHLEIVQWLDANRSEGCTTAAMDGAASGGHFDVVKWLRTHRSAAFTLDAMDGAARIGRLDIMLFLRGFLREYGLVGCEAGAMLTAAKHGHLHVTEWFHQNIREGSSRRHISSQAAYHASNPLALKWLDENIFTDQVRAEVKSNPMNVKDAVVSMVEASDFEMLEWFDAHGYLVGGIGDAVLTAGRNGDLEVLEWLFARYPSEFIKCSSGAVGRDRCYAAKWIRLLIA